MFTANIVSAAGWYADVALAALLVLFLLAGLIKGFSKSTKGFFVFVFVVCVSLMLTGLTQDAVTDSALGTSISDGLSSASADWGPAFNSPVTVSEDGVFYIMVNDTPTELNSGNFGIKGSFARFVADKFGVQTGDTVAGAAVASVTSVCVAAIMFAVFVIGIVLVFFVIRRVAAPMAKAALPGVRLLDRILGALFSAFVGLVFVWIVFAIIAAIGDPAAEAQNYLSQSAFAGLLYNNNPITTLFTRIFGS